MGECGNLLCIQEKRYTRKELSSWYKKVPYAIGLELVADNLAGSSSSGHIKTLLLPFNDMEPDEVLDFEPPSETVCNVCEGKASAADSEQENIPLTLNTSNLMIQPEVATTSQHSMSKLNRSAGGGAASAKAQRGDVSALGDMADLAAAANSSVAALGEVPSNLEGLSNFYNQLAMTNLLYQQQHLHSAAVQAALHQAGASAAASPGSAAKDVMGSQQQPPTTAAITGVAGLKDCSLDLSSLTAQHLLSEHHLLSNSAAAAAAATAAESSSSSSTANGGLKVPEIRSKKKKDCNQKKTYTERELKAAVDAIRNRTLGTRKAAQMYGVPRSTLRNKMLKETEMSRQLPESFLQFSRAAAYLDDSRGEAVHGDRRSEASSPPTSKQASPLSRKHVDNHSNPLDLATGMQHNNAFLKQLEEMRNKQGINEQLNFLNQNRIFGDMFNPLQFAAAAYPFFMPQYSAALAGMPSMDFMNPYTSSLMMPYLPEIMKNLQAQQQKQEKPSHMTSHGAAAPHMRSPSESGSRPASAKNDRDDIKIPAYKPTGASHSIDELAAQLPLLSKSAKPVLSEDNMDATSRLASPFSAVNYLQGIVPRPELAGSKRSSPTSHHIPNKKFRLDHQSIDSSQHSRPTNGTTTGKKRPKRGQYRKYDSELLAQAVRAVQRGEMSVHRAGTFFGVPHSTLEYKVKERHLLRKKKIAESNENKSASPNQLVEKPSMSSSKTTAVSESSTSSHLSESKLATQASPSPTQPGQAIDESRPFGATQNNTPPAIFDFSSAYNLNTPASDILRKLHARAHQKANEIINGAKQAQESNF